MFLRSLRFRLTLWYSLTLAVLLAASAFFWHVFLARDLLSQADNDLLTIAMGLEQSLLTGGPISCPDLHKLPGNYTFLHAIRVIDQAGNILCTSGDLNSSLGPLNNMSRQKAPPPGQLFTTIENGGFRLRVLTYPIRQDDTHLYTLELVGNLSEADRSMQRLHLAFLIIGPLVLVALTFGGWYLAQRALSPMVRMARAARQINADNLSLRLPVEHTGDEIKFLAENFNAMLARLEESFRKVKQFSGDASHELRTPLAILRGETEVSLRWGKTVEDFQRTLESNLEEINRMGRIIDDLLTLAKSDAGQLPLEIKVISLSDLLQELYMQGNTLGESKQIQVLLHMQVDEEIRIRGDELRLRQMFLNLISNGIKYTPEGGRVEISLAMEGDQAVVSVTDTGIGIPAEHLPHIFDRFYRIDKARNRADGGTGLGLAITKGIIDAHGGTVEVDSLPGEGSTFTVYLPAEGPPSQKPQASQI